MNSKDFEANQPVEIQQVLNGYLVVPSMHYQDGSRQTTAVVFQSYNELDAWLRDHFTFRCVAIDGDL